MVNAATRRREFRGILARALQERSLALVKGELGRDPRGLSWYLTLHHPRWGIQTVVVRVGEVDPYAPPALQFILERVTRWAQPAGP